MDLNQLMNLPLREIEALLLSGTKEASNLIDEMGQKRAYPIRILGKLVEEKALDPGSKNAMLLFKTPELVEKMLEILRSHYFGMPMTPAPPPPPDAPEMLPENPEDVAGEAVAVSLPYQPPAPTPEPPPSPAPVEVATPVTPGAPKRRGRPPASATAVAATPPSTLDIAPLQEEVQALRKSTTLMVEKFSELLAQMAVVITENRNLQNKVENVETLLFSQAENLRTFSEATLKAVFSVGENATGYTADDLAAQAENIHNAPEKLLKAVMREKD